MRTIKKNSFKTEFLGNAQKIEKKREAKKKKSKYALIFYNMPENAS